jgi:release factor glutamine methyltransferase
VENGRLDAELMLAQVLGLGRLDLYLQFERPIAPRELAEFKAYLLRRAKREPLQYILGTTAFRELELKTDPRALIPRPETEVLVEEVLDWARGEEPNLVGLDLGTGTGAIALSLLTEGPFRTMVGTDPDPGALELARENARASGLDGRLELRLGGLFQPIRPEERFDVVVSNPPYIRAGERGNLQPEVRDWEPSGALFAGSDGLEVVVPLVEGAHRVLRPGGLLAVEVGDGQGAEVARAMEGLGVYREVGTRADLSGRERIVRGVAIG